MFEGVVGVDAFAPVEHEEVLEEVETVVAEAVAEAGVDVASFGGPLAYAFAARELRPAWHGVFIGRADELEDDLGLVEVSFTFEDRAALKELCEDTASAPHVYCWRVATELEEKLWWSVPSCYDKSGIIANCVAIAAAWTWCRSFVVSRKAKVSYLQLAFVGDEDVGCLHISVENVRLQTISAVTHTQSQSVMAYIMQISQPL